jgi:chromosomal replication initiation ATPase DnaA
MYGKTIFINDIARLRNRCRKTEIVNMRFIYFKIARLLGNTLDSIADSMATSKSHRYDHTTIMYGVGQFDNIISRDERFRELYLSVIDKIKKKYSKYEREPSTSSR